MKNMYMSVYTYMYIYLHMPIYVYIYIYTHIWILSIYGVVYIYLYVPLWINNQYTISHEITLIWPGSRPLQPMGATLFKTGQRPPTSGIMHVYIYVYIPIYGSWNICNLYYVVAPPGTLSQHPKSKKNPTWIQQHKPCQKDCQQTPKWKSEGSQYGPNVDPKSTQHLSNWSPESVSGGQSVKNTKT